MCVVYMCVVYAYACFASWLITNTHPYTNHPYTHPTPTPGETSGPSAIDLYGACEFTTHTPGQVSLTRELQEATWGAIQQGLMPRRDNATEQWERQYWSAMGNGTGHVYAYDADAPPRLYTERECVEVDG